MSQPDTTRDLIRHALYDAIDWQDSLADAWAPGTPERQECRDQAKEYRRILKRRYGSARTPAETVIDGLTTVTLAELVKERS